ncbi:hypothetical protein COL154_013832 [Colletotrichum chrysophilum]|nr:hypothetical protein KNSL1_013588 [Colletotrichum chrysophilum]KAJ0347556.1 hypothetical protein COL154_013832 [Colletotrichum chrysophilum]
MIEWVLRPNRQHGLVDYIYCPGAKITTAFKAKTSTSNIVDIRMVIRPPEGSPGAVRIDQWKGLKHGRNAMPAIQYLPGVIV